MSQKILIIEDDRDSLKMIGVILEKEGYNIVATQKGKRGLDLAKTTKPDLVVLDLMLPDMDGLQIAHQLRDHPETARIPLLMFTAKSQPDDKITGLESGADAYVTKPAKPAELIAQANALLRRTEQQAPSSIPAPGKSGILTSVIAAKGGIGVTTLATNLAFAIHQPSSPSILSDFRPGQGSISLDLGLPPSAGLMKLLDKSPRDISSQIVEETLLTHETGLKMLLSSPRPRNATYLSKEKQFQQITQSLLHLSPHVILDLGSTFSSLVVDVLKKSHKILLCLEPTPQNITHTAFLLDDAVGLGIDNKKIALILIKRKRLSIQLTLEEVQNRLGRSITHVFTPAPELAYQAAIHHKPMVLQSPESIIAKQFMELADSVFEPSQ